MRIQNLEELTKAKKKVEDEVVCPNHNCMTYGNYLNCYKSPQQFKEEHYLQCIEFRKHLERKYAHEQGDSDSRRGL
jgi:hypothetical protein